MYVPVIWSSRAVPICTRFWLTCEPALDESVATTAPPGSRRKYSSRYLWGGGARAAGSSPTRIHITEFGLGEAIEK